MVLTRSVRAFIVFLGFTSFELAYPQEPPVINDEPGFTRFGDSLGKGWPKLVRDPDMEEVVVVSCTGVMATRVQSPWFHPLPYAYGPCRSSLPHDEPDFGQAAAIDPLLPFMVYGRDGLAHLICRYSTVVVPFFPTENENDYFCMPDPDFAKGAKPPV